MLTKLSLLLAASTVVLSATAASAGDYSYRYHHRHHHHYSDRNALTFDFGSVAFGYNDGYWDNGHRWHAWRNRGDHDGYRNHQGNNYHDWHHNRDHDNGWQNR